MSYAYLAAWLIAAGVGAYLGNQRGRPLTGFFLGVVLNVVGWLVILAIPRTYANQVERERVRQRAAADAARQVRRNVPEWEPLDVDEAADSLLERGEMP